MFIVQVSPVGPADFTIITPRYWNSLLYLWAESSVCGGEGLRVGVGERGIKSL